MIPMIDWLSITVDVEDYNNNLSLILSKLEEMKNHAQSIRSQTLSEKVLFELGQQTFQVMPTGSASYAYILRNNLMELRFAKIRSKNLDTYPIYIHFSSEFLWLNGPENCWYWFEDWISGYLASITTNKINRVDLCCHTDKIGNLSPEYFRGKYNEDNVIRTYREVTGVYFGTRKSDIYARIYNKSIEIVTHKKLWFIDIWKTKGLNPENIMNIEFELHRDFFNNLIIGDNSKIETCEDLFNNLKPLWNYCTSKWLTMILDINERTERAEIHPVWLEIQNVFSDFKGEGMISRSKQKYWKMQNLVPSAYGYISSIAACKGELDINKVLSDLVSEGNKLYKQKGTTFEETVIEKAKLMV